MEKIKEEEEGKPKDGTEIYVWGSKHNIFINECNYYNIGNNSGQLGLPMKSSNKSYNEPFLCLISLEVGKVVCGDEHTLFLTSKQTPEI